MRVQVLVFILLGLTAIKVVGQKITVNVLDDKTDGRCDNQHCSFREAIQMVNEGRGGSIDFEKNLKDTLWLETPLPELIGNNCLIKGWEDQPLVISTKAGIRQGLKIKAQQVTISQLIFSGFDEFGLEIDSLANIVLLLGNEFNENGKGGVCVRGATNINIGQNGQSNKFINNGEWGIYLEYNDSPSLLSIEGNLIKDNPLGILGKGLSAGSYFGNNYISKVSKGGVSLIHSNNTRIFYNEIIESPVSGIQIDSSINISIQENVLAATPIGIHQKNGGYGNRYSRNKFECVTQPIVWDRAEKAPNAPHQICYSGSISGLSSPFAQVEIYRLSDSMCQETECSSWEFLTEVQSDRAGNWKFLPNGIQESGIAVIAFDGLGNTSVFSDCISLTNFPEATLYADASFCEGDSISLTASIDNPQNEGFIYTWTGENGFKSNGLVINTFLDSGWYTFEMEKDYCQEVVDSVYVIQKNLDTLHLGEAFGKLCYETELEFEGSIFTAANPKKTIIRKGKTGACDTIVEIVIYFLNPSIGFLNPVICETDTFEYQNEQFYKGREKDTIILPNAARSGCDSLLIIEAIIMEQPIKRVAGNLCIDEFEIINGIRYDKDHPSGQYWLPSPNLECDTLVEVNFEFHNPIYDTIKGTYCEGSQFVVNGHIYDENNPKGVEYLTSQYGCDSVITIDLTFDFNTIYYLDTILCGNETIEINGTIYNRNRISGVEQFIAGGLVNCDSIIYVEISYADKLGEISLPSNIEIEKGSSLEITPIIPFQPIHIFWKTDLNLSCYDCLSPIVLGDRSGTLYLEVTDANGCGYSASSIVELKGNRNDFAYVPNAFSPNNDGINDVFEVFPDYNWVSKVVNLKIVNRWGKVVHNSDVSKWDGTVNGQPESSEIFLYVVELLMKDGSSKKQSGSVFLYR